MPKDRPISSYSQREKARIAGRRTLYISVHADPQPKIFLRVKGTDCSAELIGFYDAIVDQQMPADETGQAGGALEVSTPGDLAAGYSETSKKCPR